MRPLAKLAPLLLLATCMQPETAPEPRGLKAVESWAIQLQGLEHEGALDRIAFAAYDMVVIDPTRTVRGMESYPTAEVVARLKKTKLCLAYINVGQAEDYRTYWRNHWKAPTKNTAGSPPYLLGVDPDGWVGNYPVAYWDLRWKAILWGSGEALVDGALADGFDGVYLDWILGYQEPVVVEAARAAGIEPAIAMATLVRDLREYAQRKRRGFVVVAQNGAELLEEVPRYAEWIDAISQEALSFRCQADAKWDDPGAGDIAIPATGGWSTQTLTRQLSRYRDAGLPVFTLDYALEPENAALARRRSRAQGFVPCVTRGPLDRLP
jgi:cysteinyl-tRNA synthetase